MESEGVSKSKAVTKTNEVGEITLEETYVSIDENQGQTNVVTWNQLKTRYASSNDDYQELADLLQSWNLFDLFTFCVGRSNNNPKFIMSYLFHLGSDICCHFCFHLK